MRNSFLKYWPVAAFILVGLAGGFLYWRLVGCNSGACPITSNWHYSSLAGGLMGYLGGSSIIDLMKKKKE